LFNINFKDKYKVVHLNNEIGNCLVGGAGTYMNEIYKYRPNDMGFIYVNTTSPFADFKTSDFLDQKDILIMHENEAERLKEIDCDLLVVHFYEFAYLITEELKKDKKIAYVIHSVPTPEPPPAHDPFGGNDHIKDKFEHLCNLADALICVSNAEREKLIWLYPHYKDKIYVVYNGIEIDNLTKGRINTNYTKSRKVFGYIGRTDYRKGIIECIEELKDLDAELRIACPKNDTEYLKNIFAYIRENNLEERVKFFGWCVGKRKESFLESLDCLIIPSLYEPFGYVALEGMYYGLPIISANNGGLDEIFEGYKYKYNPYRIGGLGQQVLEFQADTNKIIEEQQKILKENLNRFTAEEMCKNYNELWDKVIYN
jgi:glycosyltransferase involved in cell wall biosynthesis